MQKQTHNVRDSILTLSIDMIYEINKMVEDLNDKEINGPSDVTDDFSARANADQEPAGDCDIADSMEWVVSGSLNVLNQPTNQPTIMRIKT